MDVVTVVLYTLVIIVALMLIGLVLIQQSKGGGFGGSFAGVGESVFGAHAGSHLTKLTVILTTCFFVLTLLLTVIIGHRSRGMSVAEANAAAAEAKVVAEKKVSSSDEVKSNIVKNVKAEESKENTPIKAEK
jgi:preprotein translocase subunit SecG